MNKYALHVAGGALLATTALASGTVYAATVRLNSTAGAIGAGISDPTAPVTTSVAIASQFFAATTSAVTVGPMGIIIDASAAQASFQGNATQVTLNVTGAEFLTSVSPTVFLYHQDTGTSGTISGAVAAGASVFVATDRITASNITGSTWGALVFSGVSFRNAQGLATAGNTVTLSGSIQLTNLTTLESINSQSVLVGRSGASILVSSAATATVSNSSNPQFSQVTQSGATAASANLSVVNFTEVATLGVNITTAQTITAFVSTYEVKLTHAVLNDAAVSTASFGSAPVNRTPAQFVSGSVTFGTIAAISADSSALRTVSVTFNGTSQIAAAAAGTTVVTPTATNAALNPLAAGSGTAVALTRGGMNATVNYFNPSNNSIQSFLRVTNTGTTAGSVTVTVRNSSTGASIGSYTSASVAAGATIQIAGSVIESQSTPVVTPTLGVQYDLGITGPITGFVQHIGFNSVSGQLSDLSAFRTGSSGSTP